MKAVQVIEKISATEFHNEFVKTGIPVVLRNMTTEWSALRNWNSEYFRLKEGGHTVPIKTGNVSEGKKKSMLISDYVLLLEDYERRLRIGENPEPPPYLHDVPIFHIIPSLIKDIEPFPLHLFPGWYWENWQNYIQFFMGATGSLTPLHFDTLYTHNIFFQIAGRKKFILIPPDQRDKCYIHGWRWAKFDPSNPDFEKFPLSRSIEMQEANLGPGDIVFMPSGTLHQVHGLSYSISFNIDWHTIKSASKGVYSLLQGAPAKNAYYNALILTGLAMRVPPKYIFPLYKPYLNYVS